MRRKLAGIILGGLLAASWLNATAAEDSVKILLGGGLVISPGYMDFIDDAYTGYDESSGIGWLDFYGGLEFPVNPKFCIIGGCDLFVNSVDVSGGPLDETYANLILIPSVYGQLYLDSSQQVYVNGGVNLPVPSTGSDNFDFSNDGVGLGVNAGIRLAEVFRIEAGYTYVPVTVESPGGGDEDYNFGGPQLRAILSFW